eukprot:Phypoly_transcript_08993.p1 GENE.Phypoly_transcript_08993~~Phypoly_transcript_08993.p1  ORF type:complete len:386 (+),score=44.58 Phypoly_transcript_08993:266-1423(+)
MDYIGFPGKIYIRMLKCLIVPLVSLSLVGAMASLGTMKEGKVGLYAVLWYVTSTIFSGACGILWALIFRPWTQLEDAVPPMDSSMSSSDTITPRTPAESVKQIFLQLFTDNVFRSALDMDMLGIIMFSCVFGFVLASLPTEKSEKVLQLVDTLNMVIQKMVGLVIWLSPVGVLSLVAYYMGSSGDFWDVAKGIGLLLAARLTGVILHGAITLPLILFVLTKKNPYKVLIASSEIWVIAFGTSSSAATLPVTIKTVEEALEVSPPIARFVCTTGATVNMDSAAIAYSLTAVTIANALNMNLNFVQMVSVVFTSTLISIGAAALPSAGLINYIAVMSTINIPLEPAIAILSPILSVDWFEDRIMTMVNVQGDVFAAVAIHHHTKDNV